MYKLQHIALAVPLFQMTIMVQLFQKVIILNCLQDFSQILTIGHTCLMVFVYFKWFAGLIWWLDLTASQSMWVTVCQNQFEINQLPWRKLQICQHWLYWIKGHWNPLNCVWEHTCSAYRKFFNCIPHWPNQFDQKKLINFPSGQIKRVYSYYCMVE